MLVLALSQDSADNLQFINAAAAAILNLNIFTYHHCSDWRLDRSCRYCLQNWTAQSYSCSVNQGYNCWLAQGPGL